MSKPIKSEDVSIYALLDPVTGDVRYVGKTSLAVRTRLRQHMSLARHVKLNNNVCSWINSLTDRPKVTVLESVPDGEDWQSRERHWIRVMREQGAQLCNLNDGGDGMAGRRLTQRERLQKSENRRRGMWLICSVCDFGFWRPNSRLKNDSCLYCSSECKHKSMRRSGSANQKQTQEIL